MALADVVFEIASHGHPVEVSRGVLKAFLGSHVCHLLMSDAKDFASDVVSFIDCFIGNYGQSRQSSSPLLRRSPSMRIQLGWLEFLLTMSKRGSDRKSVV